MIAQNIGNIACVVRTVMGQKITVAEIIVLLGLHDLQTAEIAGILGILLGEQEADPVIALHLRKGKGELFPGVISAYDLLFIDRTILIDAGQSVLIAGGIGIDR